ncbi:MAG: hypothetical protein ACRD5G_08200 [Candidatus Acidiferrales bacterium]
MKCQKALLFLAVLALTLGVVAAEQTVQRTKPSDVESATTAAQKGLQNFAALVTKDNFEAMGFDNPEQVRTATLGAPVEQYVIGLDDVLRFKSASDLPQMVRSAERVTFPVVVNGRSRSAVTVRRQNNRWEPESFGAPRYIQMLTEVRERLAAEKQRPAGEFFEVRIPALNLTFLGHAQDARLFLALVHDAPGLALKRGVLSSAEDVMKVIEPLAREHNRLPT